MTHLGYLLVGWGLTIGSGVLYSVHLVRRGRTLAARVSTSRQRWMTADDQ